jgi:hypothetical protein
MALPASCPLTGQFGEDSDEVALLWCSGVAATIGGAERHNVGHGIDPPTESASGGATVRQRGLYGSRRRFRHLAARLASNLTRHCPRAPPR